MKELKKQLRKVIAEKKSRYSNTELTGFSVSALDKLEQMPVFILAETVLLYHSLKDEVYTHEFVEKWKDKKNLLLPVVTGNELELRRYSGKQDLETGSYGIEEPTGELFTDYQEIDLAIIPGVSFDADGNRLGRGKGYYDRLLPKLNAYNIGLCFSFQVCENIPAESFDIKMDAVLTDKEFHSRED